MSRGPNWEEDEARICEFMWRTGKTDLEISQVLTRRNEVGIKSYRISKGWVTPKIRINKLVNVNKEISREIFKKPRADALPDIGEQVAKLIEKQTLMETTLWAINCKVGELIELQKASNSMSKDGLELWRAADARVRSPTRT